MFEESPRRPRTHPGERPRDPRPGLRRRVWIQGKRPAEEGRGPLRRRAKPRPPGQGAALRRQRTPSRRADQRPGRRYPAGLRGGAARLPRLCGGHQPRPLVFLDRVATGHVGCAFEGDSEVRWWEGNFSEATRSTGTSASVPKPTSPTGSKYKPLVRGLTGGQTRPRAVGSARRMVRGDEAARHRSTRGPLGRATSLSKLSNTPPVTQGAHVDVRTPPASTGRSYTHPITWRVD